VIEERALMRHAADDGVAPAAHDDDRDQSDVYHAVVSNLVSLAEHVQKCLSDRTDDRGGNAARSSTNVIVCSTTHLRAMRRAPPRCGPATSTLDIALRSLLDAGDGDRFAAGRRVPSLIGA
jgi:hypothetical protein